MELDEFLNYLIKKEEKILNIYNECNELESKNKKLVDFDYLDRLDKEINNLKLIINQDDSAIKLNDEERIKKFYEKKDELFIKLNSLTKIHRTETTTQQTITRQTNNQQMITQQMDQLKATQLGSNRQSNIRPSLDRYSKSLNESIDKSKEMLMKLRRCDAEMTKCLQNLNQIESKYKSQM